MSQPFHTTVPYKPTPKPRSIALDRMNQLSNIQLSNQKSSSNACRQSPEHDDVEEKRLSPDYLEGQRVSEDDPHSVSSPAPDNTSSKSGEKSPFHPHNSNEVSVESSNDESFENGHGKERFNAISVMSLIVKKTLLLYKEMNLGLLCC